jgi:hypothetical protein
MELKNIILFVIIIILLILVIRYISSDVNTLSGLTSGQTSQKIEASNLDSSSSSGTSNFSYSIWFYIDDWNYKYGETKVLYGRMAAGKGKEEPCPLVALGPVENNITVSIAVYPGLDDVPTKVQNNDMNSNYPGFDEEDRKLFGKSESVATTVTPKEVDTILKPIVHTCMVPNVPIQRWVNLFVSVYNRTLDIYIDGKLVKTCVLPGVAKIDRNAPVYVTPAGGFSGWTSTFQYWNDSSDPQKAWNVYKKGYGGSWLGNIFGKYSVKVSLMEGDVEDSSWKL